MADSENKANEDHTGDKGIPTAGYGEGTVGPGAVIGRYKLLRILGEGGYGIVYLAEQQRPVKRRVALKVIKPGMDTKQVIARFEAERQALALLDHPNIAHVFNAGTTEAGRPYFAMEYVKGVPITEHCDRYKLTIEERLKLFLAVCEAVQHAHQKAIIHRDIKPSNILIAYEGEQAIPMIIDFGVAKALTQSLTDRTLVTEQAQMIGTPEYMSPEQAEMTSQDIDTRTDIYSLGVLLYELLTGTLPFDPRTLREGGPEQMRRLIREQDPQTPSARLSTIENEKSANLAQQRRTDTRTWGHRLHGELDWITLKAMDKDRTRRYQTAHALAEDIQRYLNQEPVLAGPPSEIYRLKKLLFRHRTKAIAAAAVAILIAAVAIISAMYAQSVNRGKEAKALEHREILSKALEFRSNGQFEEAMAELAAILNSEYVAPEARLLQARLVMELDGPDAALAELEKLLDERDEIACQAHFLLARVYLESDADDPNTALRYQQQAKEHQQRGEELFSESAEAYFNRAMLAGTVNKTLECLNEAIDLDPGHYPSRKARALAHYAIGDYRNMERDAVVMTSLRNWDSLGYSLMAISLRETGDYMEALQYHNKAIEISPKDPELYDHRCQTYVQMANYEQALLDAEQCIRFNPNEGMYYFNSFCALTALGRYDEAHAKYDAILESSLMTRWQFERLAAKYAADTLDAGLSWYPPGQNPIGAAFLAMHDTVEIHKGLAKKARRLVPEGFHPTWSPDGTELAYSRGHPGFAGIEIVNLRTNRTRLLTVPGFDPAWSPDGRYIAFNRGPGNLLLTEFATVRMRENPSNAERELWLIKADGTEEPRFLAMGYWPSWSNDSKRIFYHSQPDEMVYSISPKDGASPTPIIRCKESTPTVSPDGKYVACPGRKSRILELSANSVVADCSMPPVAGGGHMNWSPDGRELAIGGDGLWIYDLNTRAGKKVLHGVFGWCSWSRSDTRQLAIQNNSVYGGHREIWVANLDPNVSTTQAFGPGRTIEEHLQEEIDGSTHLINYSPEELVNYLWRGACYIVAREYDEATTDFEEIASRLAGNSTSGLPWWMSGFTRRFGAWGIDIYGAGEYEQALVVLTAIDKVRRAAGADPNAAGVAYIAMSLRQLGRGDEVTAYLKGCIASGLNAWQVRRFMNGLGSCGIDQYEAGKYGQALILLTDVDKVRRAEGGDPNSLETAYMAMSLHQLGRREEAVSTLEQLYRMFDSTKDDKLLKWLCRAEKVLAGDASIMQPAWERIELGKLNDARQHLEELTAMADNQRTDIAADIARAARFLARAYCERGRGAMYKDTGYGEAISNYRAAVEVDPNYARAFGELGWLLATCPESELRDEAMAIGNVTNACEVTDWKNHRHVGVLAAVYAEVGDFEEAVKWQQEATDLLTEEDRARWQAIHKSRLRLYQSGKPYPGAHPYSRSAGQVVACWDFERSDGEVVEDSSGNGLDGTLVGDARIIDDLDRGGRVLYLDGNGDWVDCGRDPRFDIISEITVVCWVKVRRFDRDWQTIISKGDSTWRLARDRDQDGLEFACSDVSIPGTEWGNILGKRNANDGRWHQVVGVYDGLWMYLYVDGVLDISSQASGEIATNTWSVLIGANEEITAQGEPDRSFNGLIDDLRIYDYALTEGEIKKLYDESEFVPDKD